ncbi:hypothetical protein GIB67_018502 [Kingdonia uniflora]|uniref:Uncharacterized protein n=1 Tax=Kingdonia uniflora TaxID=39325 RepID=A0A7J7LW86_9MAGN|nr:hypothetical protein GIB67_018502 [Kingdonia uniflora]
MLLPKSLDNTRAPKGSVIPEWENEPRHRTLYFVNQSQPCVIIAEPPLYVSVLDVLAVVVSQVLGSPIYLPIGSLLSRPEGSKKRIFGSLKLGSYRSEIGNDGDKLKYGRVPGDIRPSAGQALQVFSFRNISTTNESSLSTFPDEGKTEMGNRKLVQVLESTGSVKSSSSKWYQICTVKRIKLEVHKPEVRSCNKNS